ncbi:MAG: HD domain-containing protein [Anaerolineales bacterium]|nr:HD domain-containing protein [Anaerolineales bacterium]
MGIIYRSGQFWQALLVSPSADDMELVRSILPSEQWQLFKKMSPAEQVHCIKTARCLIKKEHRQPDLLAAALLHDVGKTVYPLRLWERVWLVIGNTFFPKWTARWRRETDFAALNENYWQRVFVVFHRHAGWGADLAKQAGASPLCVNLIRRHQDEISMDANSMEDRLLFYLQEADNLS